METKTLFEKWIAQQYPGQEKRFEFVGTVGVTNQIVIYWDSQQSQSFHVLVENLKRETSIESPALEPAK